MKTYSARPAEVHRDWLLVDADGLTLGRLATQIAMVLRGKHKPMFTPHIDTGDHVVVVNASRVRLTGSKIEKESYFRHTMYPGGARFTPKKVVLQKHPERVLMRAVKGMMPGNKLGRAMMRKLKIYAGPEHPHSAQMPKSWEPDPRGRRVS